MNKIVLVTRKTRLADLIYKYNTIEQAKFYIEHLGVDFSDYLLEDRQYQQAVDTVASICENMARLQVVDRDVVPNMMFGQNDIVIAVGQDGLVANTMKYLDGQPLIGVNPDVKRWDGVLLPFEPGDMENILQQVIGQKHHEKKITMAEAKTTDGQSMLAVNDLFIGQKSHVSARYDLTMNGTTENQSSSGIIVSTGLGATGWYKSIIAQMQGMQGYFGKDKVDAKPWKWEENRLSFVVREPYPSRATQADLVFGMIQPGDSFQIVSKMPEGGVIFSDGMERDAIDFIAGMQVTISSAPQKGRLVVR